MNLTFKRYLSGIGETSSLGNATEHSYRSFLKKMFEEMDNKITVLNEPKRSAFGAPDLIVYSNKQSELLKIGFIETKIPGEDLDAVLRTEQMERYLNAIDNLILTDYIQFRLYVKGQLRLKASLGDVKGKKPIISPKSFKPVESLIRCFLDFKPESIKNSKELADRLARLTYLVREKIRQNFKTNSASQTIIDLYKAFQDVLVPNLTEVEFADMFAQTLTFGLFAARVNHNCQTKTFQRIDAASRIPKTNPFLRKLFSVITGPDLEDEPFAAFVDDLVTLLAHSDISALLKEFYSDDTNDPLIHFYETFLSSYDPKVKEKRGVFYTPKPIVSYITRCVDSVLKSDFKLEDGIADSSTTVFSYKDREGRQIVENKPRVMILDPACGTGTFLYHIIDHIRRHYMNTNNAGRWSGDVKRHLVDRLFGFELMMAPYVLAHVKLGMQLAALDLPENQRKDWVCDLTEGRLGVYLTNSLEEGIKKSEILLGSFISEEANAAVDIKRNLPIMVIIGNPPYKGISANNGEWIQGLLRGKLPNGKLAPNYYTVNGKPLNEKKLWLQDDYVKFFRLGHWKIEETGQGVLAFITNHGYIDNPTFRGMREKLLNTFTKIFILDLHGNSNKQEKCPDGTIDENVFDIKQGVAIGIFIKEPDKQGPAKVFHSELWGKRQNKYNWLSNTQIDQTTWTQVSPVEPFYLFKPTKDQETDEYKNFWSIVDILPVKTSGIITSRDKLVIGLSDEDLRVNMNMFKNSLISNEEIRERFSISENKYWNLTVGRKMLLDMENLNSFITDFQYRPFDVRRLFYHRGIIFRPRQKVMKHMLTGKNLGLITARSNKSNEMNQFYCTRLISEAKCGESTTQSYLFPLYLYTNSFGEKVCQPNLNPKFTNGLEEILQMKFVKSGKGDLISTFGPEDIFGYIYAIFYSTEYRTRYKDHLRLDFPKIPFPTNRDLFTFLSQKGSEIVAWQLEEMPFAQSLKIQYPIPGTNLVEPGFPQFTAKGEIDSLTGKPVKEGRIYINKSNDKEGKRGQYFEGVSKEVWEFEIGGYRVIKRWLQSRKGTVLNAEGINKVESIVISIKKSLEKVKEIDGKLAKWPFLDQII